MILRKRDERLAAFSKFLLSPAGLRRRRGEPFLVDAQFLRRRRKAG
jgi:hypothetical protein